MTRLTLIGIDPGIRDTAGIKIDLDFSVKSIQLTTKVWEEVAKKVGRSIKIEEKFLDEVAEFVQNSVARNNATFTGIEGYRERGYDMFQDQAMILMVQTLNQTIPASIIVENTGMRQVVKEPTMKLFHCTRFTRGGNHSDIKSAARVALRLGINIPSLNELLSTYMEDHLYKETPWQFRSTLTA